MRASTADWEGLGGLEGEGGSESESSFGCEGLSRESDGGGWWTQDDGGETSGLASTEVEADEHEADGSEGSDRGERGEAGVAVVHDEEGWEVEEALRAARLCEEASELFRHAQCVIERDLALQNRDVARTVAAEFNEAPLVLDLPSWLAQELPLPHVMACFDTRSYEAADEVGPVVVEREAVGAGGNSSSGGGGADASGGGGMQWEQEVFLSRCSQAGRSTSGVMSMRLVSLAAERDEAFAAMLAELRQRTSHARERWRLARLLGMAQSRDADERYWALRSLDSMLISLQVTLCDVEIRRKRHKDLATILARDRGARVQIKEIAMLDYNVLRAIVKAAVRRLEDEERFNLGAALFILKHALEYGDTNLTAFVRRLLRRLYSQEDLQDSQESQDFPDGLGGEGGREGGAGALEGRQDQEVPLERDMRRLLDWEEDLVEASKKKGGIVRILEKELTDKENTLEAAKMLTERKNLLNSELLTEAARVAIMQKPARVPTAEELAEDARVIKAENPLFGVRRIWSAMKERHPDWTVPEGRVHKVMATMLT